MRIGFIGLGIMGSRMAANLMKAGNELVLWNRSRERMKPLEKLGAEPAGSPAALARSVRVLFTMLSTPDAVRETAAGPDGFLDALEPGSLWIDSSTVNPTFSREMAELAVSRGVRFIDAPVSGSKLPAEKGELIVLAGGTETDLAEAAPYFAAIGKKTVHAGGHGAGAAMKMVVNLMLAHGMAAYVEAIALGEALGFTKGKLAEVLLGSHVTPAFLQGKQAKLEQGEYGPEFPLRHMLKDLHLALVSAWEERTALPVTGAVKELFALAELQGFGELDLSAVYRVLERPERD